MRTTYARSIRGVGPAAVLALSVAFWPSSSVAQDSVAALVTRWGVFRSPRVKESSGVAVSRRHPGLLWTHNDSGDGPFLYAVDSTGNLLATYRVQSAKNVDWEDLALAPCPNLADSSCLYIADTGDNSESRRSVTLYVVREPAAPARPPMAATSPPVPSTPRDSGTAVPLLHRLVLRYPDRPHDVEALAVAPTGQISLITKGRTGPIRRFVLDRSAFARDSAIPRADQVLPIRPDPTLGYWVTGAAFSPDGHRLAVRTYRDIFLFDVGSLGLLNVDPIRCAVGPAEPQGEGIAFLDDSAMVLTSETAFGQLGTILRVVCPEVGRSRIRRSS